MFSESIPLAVNRLAAPGNYDVILIFGATVPHEVAGFAGGAKYFFPGIAGAELTHKTHWLAALATIEKIIGRIETPTRHLIEAAADRITAKVITFTSVVTRTDDDRLRTHALFAGDFRPSLRMAAEVSRHVHIKYTGRKYRRVVALLDEHYEDLWLGGKASYRLGAVIEQGGELIIYAPRLRCISETHGHDIERFGGYAPLEKIKDLVSRSGELQANLCVAAHLAHVSYAGRQDENGGFVPRYRITLASQVDSETCRRVNLDHLDFQTFNLADYQNDPDTLDRRTCGPRPISGRSGGRLTVVIRQKIFADRRENVDQDHLFFQHRGAVPVVRREVKDIAGGDDPHLAADRKLDLPLNHKRDLFVRVCMLGRDNERVESEPAHHYTLAHDHLSFYSGGRFHGRNLVPIGNKCGKLKFLSYHRSTS